MELPFTEKGRPGISRFEGKNHLGEPMVSRQLDMITNLRKCQG